MARPPSIAVSDGSGGSERYIPAVLLIHTKFPDGSPALMKLIRDSDSIELAGGEEFMIVYAPEKMVKKS